MRKCSLPDCPSPLLARGFCRRHYERNHKYGDPNYVFPPELRKPRIRRPLRERWEKYVDRDTSIHWMWTGATTHGGYGVIADGERRLQRAHRLAWQFANGPIPDDLLVLHHCDTPGCVKTEPDEQFPEGHLFLGTQLDNVHDMIAKGRMIYPDGRLRKNRRHGADHPRAKLTEDDVRELRVSRETLKVLARRYGVSIATVDAIRHRRSWKSLPDL